MRLRGIKKICPPCLLPLDEIFMQQKDTFSKEDFVSWGDKGNVGVSWVCRQCLYLSLVELYQPTEISFDQQVIMHHFFIPTVVSDEVLVFVLGSST